jgi:hypothetical protein
VIPREDQSRAGRAVTRATRFSERRDRAMLERARRLAKLRDERERQKKVGLNRELSSWR